MDYAFIRLVDKLDNGKDWCQTDKAKTSTDKPQLYISKLVQVSKRDLAINNDSLK